MVRDWHSADPAERCGLGIWRRLLKQRSANVENIILKDILDLGFNGVILAICGLLWVRLNKVTDILIGIAESTEVRAAEVRRSLGQEETD